VITLFHNWGAFLFLDERFRWHIKMDLLMLSIKRISWSKNILVLISRSEYILVFTSRREEITLIKGHWLQLNCLEVVLLHIIHGTTLEGLGGVID